MDKNEEITLENIVNHNDRLLNHKRNSYENNSTNAIVVKGTSNEEKTKEQNMHNEEMRELLSTDNVADFMREIAESLGFVNSGDTVYRAPDAGK